MMKQGHYAAASPISLVWAWVLVLLFAVNIFIALACAGIVIWSSTWNDLDHPRFKGKMHPGAALSRGSGRIFYQLRTERDKVRSDVHRGPSHCIEWCVLVGVLFTVLLAFVPPLAPWSVWFGASIALGTFSHVLADSMTPSGVPLSAVYNALAYKEVWRRHALGWFSTDSGAEKFAAVPVLYLITTLIFLAMVGALNPIVHWLSGGLLS